MTNRYYCQFKHTLSPNLDICGDSFNKDGIGILCEYKRRYRNDDIVYCEKTRIMKEEEEHARICDKNI